VRTIHHNRQERRAAQCMRARRPGEPAPYRRDLVLRAYGGDLARLAEDIADELDLSHDLIEDLLWPECTRT
jgi:hypothetical protein